MEIKMKIFKEFKEFIAKVNAIDLAIGVVIGGAFKSIVDSLVADIIMPFIGFIGSLIMRGATAVGAEDVVNKAASMKDWIIPGTEIAIGSFIGSIINFLIVAFVLFCVIKGINRMRETARKKEETEIVAAPTQEELLAEIRDLLKEKKD